MTAGSPAEKAGICPDERIVSINGEPVADEIDYQALSAARSLDVVIDGGGKTRTVHVTKAEWDPLGLCLDETEAMKPRHCRNRCIFCFIDQLPQGLRDTLYVKDDDWRLSLMMGNYVTLTNVSDAEFERILARKASPLYISVQATEPAVRCMMLSNRHAGSLMERLTRLKEAGLPRRADLFSRPMPFVTETYHEGDLPSAYEGLRVEPENVSVSALKRAEDGGGWVLRAWETAGEACRARVFAPLFQRDIALAFSPFEIKTVYIPSDPAQAARERRWASPLTATCTAGRAA